MILTFKFRVHPTRSQHRALERVLEDQRQLYNAALAERIDAYRKATKSITFVDQCKELTEWRGFDECAAATPLNLQRWTLKRLDDSYNGFFRRLKKGGKAGFPRFRGKGRWNSFGFAEFSGIRFNGKRLRFKGLPGGLRVRLHRPMPEGKPKSCIFIRDDKGWAVCFAMDVPTMPERQPVTTIGIDVGLTQLATLSTGEAIANQRYGKRAERELCRRQRALARCKRGSNRRRKVRAKVARLHRKVADTRNTYLHQVSADLVKRFDLIAVEKLTVKGLAGSRLAKSVHDASWGRLHQLLAYKAECAGARLIEVDPKYTSQACSGCGVIVKKDLSVRVHHCIECGTVLDRDHNAALNILHRAVVRPDAVNVGQWPERRHGNINLEAIAD